MTRSGDTICTRSSKAIADEDDFLEVKPEFAGEIITGFARIRGRTVGIVANQPMVMAGCMTVTAPISRHGSSGFVTPFSIPSCS